MGKVFKKTLITVLFCCIPLILSAAISHNKVLKYLHFHTSKNTGQHLKILTIINARDGYIHLPKNENEVHKLVLNRIEPSIIYFADIPSRQSGLMTMKHFIELWQHHTCSANDREPNATLVIRGGHHSKLSLNHHVLEDFITLKNPTYNAKASTLTFSIHSMNDKLNQYTEGKIGDSSLLVYFTCY